MAKVIVRRGTGGGLPGTPVETTMRRWFDALSSRDTAAARILAWGDSRTEGQGATTLANRWQEVLTRNLRATFTVTTGTPGYVPHNYSPVKYVSTTLAALGDWSAVSSFSAPNNYGLGTRVIRMLSAGHGATLTFTGTSLKLAYVLTSTGGSFTYSVDGGPAVLVEWPVGDIIDGRTVSIQGLASGPHTIVVKWVSGEVYLEGALLFNGEGGKGIQFYDAGHSGTRSDTAAGAGLEFVTQNVAVINPALVVLGLGTNDYSASIDPVTYKANMKAFIQAIKDGCSIVPSIVLTLDWARTGSYTYTWKQYLDALRQIAAEDPDQCITLFDLQASFPAYTDNSLGYFTSDLIHETNAGQAERARLLQQLISPTGTTPETPPDENTGIPTVASSELPFDRATDAYMSSLGPSTYIVAPHIMMTWRRRIANINYEKNPTTAYERYWLPPGGIEGAGQTWETDWRPVGGFVRDYAMAAEPGNPTTWETDDKVWELQQMKRIGIRVAICDILGSDTFKHAQQWAAAAAQVGDFKLIPMLDSNASIVRNGAVNAASFITQLFSASNGDVWLRTALGEKIVSAYSPETCVSSTKTAETDAQVEGYWKTFWDTMTANGHSTRFAPCHSRSSTDTTEHTVNVFGNGTVLKPWLVALGEWGVRNPVGTNSLATTSPARVKDTWSVPAYIWTGAFQDARPDQDRFEEAGGFENMIAVFKGFMARCGPADWLQLATWNDRREGSGIEPSRYNGFTTLDAMAYFVEWLRTGRRPTILRDCAMVAYRQHQSPTVTPQPTYSAGAIYTHRMVRAGSTVERNQVDALIFSKADGGSVQITIGGVAQTLTLPVQDGVTVAQTGTTVTVPTNIPVRVQCALAPAAVGALVVSIRRGGVVVHSVANKREINFTTQLVQDMQYILHNGLRG